MPDSKSDDADTRPVDTVVMPIYGLVFMVPEQKAIIHEHCFGTCGHIIFGGLDGGPEFGPLMVCRTKECPQLDKEINGPIGDVDGDPVFIRKLKA